jgi:hypothetical protein
MKAIKYFLNGLFLIVCLNTYSQTKSSKSDFEQITETLMDYIEGTANGEPDRLRKAFHKDFNL